MRCTKSFSATRLPRFLAWFLVVASLLTGFATFRLNTQTATAATNNTLNFQARLMQASGAIVPDGTYNVEFKIYNASSSAGSSQGSCTGDAACKWTETRTGGNKISVANGYLTANLGSVTTLPAIDWDQELWLTMNIGGTGTPGWDGEMSPRLKLTAVPYALSAGQLAATNGSFRSNLSFVQPTANRSVLIPDASGTICLQSSAACGFVTGSATDFIQNQNSTNQTANFRISGTGRANTAIMTPLLQPTADGTTALKIQNTAATITAMAVDTTNGRITVGANTAAQETLDVVGNLQVRDAATATKSYRLRTSGGALDFEASGANLVLSTWSGAGYTGTQYNQITFKSDGSSMDFARGFNVSDAAARVGLAGNVNPQYSLDVNGDINTSTQYRIGGTVICTASGCTPAAGSANYIQNQNSSDQTANFRINGTGRANTSLQTPLLDTATAVALDIGTTNATAINLNKATVVTGALTQSGGAINMTGNAASQIITTSNNNMAVRAGGTATLTLNTSGAGTVNVGIDNTTTVNIGGGTDVARTIRVGDPQSAGTAAQTVSVGSQRTTSTTTVQGGNGNNAIAINTASGGNIAISAQGSGGGVGSLVGSDGFTIKTSTNSSTALAVLDSNDLYMFSVNTTNGTVTMGAIQATYSGFDGTIAAPFGSLTLGSTGQATTLQGNASMTLKATSGSFTTTVGFVTPTANRAINFGNESGTVCLQSATTCNFAAATGSANYIQNTTTLQSANMAVQAATSGSVAAVLQANAAGTGDILSLRNGAGGVVASFGYGGAVNLKTTTDSLNGFRVQNSGNVAVLNVDTINQRVAIGNVAPVLKFEVQGGDAAIYNSGNNARLVLGDSATAGQYGWLQWDSANDYFRIETAGNNGVKIKDNFVSIGNIAPTKPLIVGSGTNALFEVGATGAIQARTSTNTQNAFQLQNNLSEIFFNADSTNKRIGIGDGMVAPEVTLDVKGVMQQTGLQTSDTGAADNNKWTRLGTCTITAQYNQCLTKLEILGGQDGSTGNNSQATVSVRVKQQNALGGAPYVNVTLNDTAEVITKSDIVAVTTVNTGTTTTVALYARITNTFETWFYAPVLNTGAAGESTWDWSPFNGFAAALPGGAQTPARYGNTNANLMTVEATNANAMVIQNAGGVNKLLVADTTTMRLAVNQATAAYTLDVAGDINTTTQLRIAGTSICDTTGCTAKTGSGFYIHNQLTVQASNFWVQSATTGTVAGIIQGFNGGTADVMQVKNGAGTNTATYGYGGSVNFRTTTNSGNGFRIQNSAGDQVFNVDTIDNILMLGTGFGGKHFAADIETNPYLELADTTGNGVGLTQVEGGKAYLTHDTDLIIQRTANGTTDLQVLDSGDVAQFTVDTSGKRIVLGTSDTTGTVLVLDTKTGSGDPAGTAATNGAMYYNSNMGVFRCYESGAWADCLSRHVTTLGSDVNNATTTLADATGLSFSATSGKTYRFHAHIIYAASAATIGSVWSANAPSTSLLGFTAEYASGTATQTTTYSSLVNTPTAANANSANTTGNIATIDGILTPSANGTVVVRFASETGGSITAKAGSTIEWW